VGAQPVAHGCEGWPPLGDAQSSFDSDRIADASCRSGMANNVKQKRNPRVESARFDLYSSLRRNMEEIWELVSKPVKFPARRRRGDREVPIKAA